MTSNLSEQTMKFHENRASKRRAVAVLGTAATVLAALAGCTQGKNDEREYSVPQSACGIPINAKELLPFLPPGKKLSVKTTSQSDNVFKCAISVDGKLIVQTSQEWWNDMSVLEFARGMTLDDPDQRTNDGTFAYSGYQAFGKAADCRSDEHEEQVLYTAVQASGSKHRDADAMKRLISDFTQAVEKSQACHQ
jgi:hypothetical protein